MGTPSNVLDYADQAVFLAEQATGTTNLLQCVWMYDRPVDAEALGRFHRNLASGRLSRRIERSAIPFGRHRWVSAADTAELEISPARPRADVEGWLAEQSRTRLDCVDGPGWHLALLPLSDGGAALSLVISHCLTDGVGLCMAIAEAASGAGAGVAWPPARSRSRCAAVREDLGRSARDLPAVGRGLRAAVAMARRGSGKPKTTPASLEYPHERLTLPTATAVVDAAEWDAAVERLGGTGNALVAGLAADLGRRLGRVHPADGTVSLSLPVADRAEDETRANAVSSIDVVVDPTGAATDLRKIRAAIKAALTHSDDVRDERWEVIPLIPLISRRAFRRMLAAATGQAGSIVSSNLGDVEATVNRPDGKDADHFVMRPLYPGVTREVMHKADGVLAIGSGRINGEVFLVFLSYQPGRNNSDHELRQTVSELLADFSLTWSTPWPAA